MKKMKKILAVVMVMALLVCTMPITGASAVELIPITQLKLDNPVEVKIGSYLPAEFVPEKDGWYKFYSTGDYDTSAILLDSRYEEVAYGDDPADLSDLNFVLSAKLKAGKPYFLYVDGYDDDGNDLDSVKVCVTVTETVGVESLEVTQLPYDTTVVKGFEEETYDCCGLEIRFTLSDGSTVDWSFDSDEEIVADNYVMAYPVFPQDGGFIIAIECGGAYGEIEYTVIESNVESIEYKCDTPIEMYQNSNGYYDEYTEQYYYFYDIPQEAVLVINYKDGSSEEVKLYDNEDVALGWYDEQHEEAWNVGTHYMTISYYDVTVEVPVTILPSPYKSVTVNSQPNVEYIFGDYEFGYLEDGVYWFAPYILSGMSFTVEYEDGTTQTFDDDDFDFDNVTIDNFEYTVSIAEVSGEGQVDAVLYYKGTEIPFTVNVVESYVESIEVLKPPVKTEFEDYYYADYTGMVVKINYKDGTSAQAEANADTMSYDYVGDVICKIKVGDDVVRIYNEYDFETDELVDYITCAGVGFHYDSVKYKETRYVTSFDANKVTMSGDGMEITVHYKDGTSEELVFDVLDYMINADDYTEACAMTSNGVITFGIEKWIENNGNTTKYEIYLLDTNLIIDAEESSPALEGDVDGDGKVSVMDATAIQLHLAQMISCDEVQLKLADTDNDGKVSVMDATQIQLFLAQMLPEL